MAKISSETIARYYDRLGWSYHVVDEATVVTGFRCPVPFYDYHAPLEVKVGEHWTYLRSLLQRDVAPDRNDAVLRFISQLNQHAHCVRFLLVRDCVIAQAEIPVARCHYGAFMDALVAVCRSTFSTGIEIAVLATNRSASDLYLEVLDESLTAQRTGRLIGLGTQVMAVDDQALDFDLAVNRLPD